MVMGMLVGAGIAFVALILGVFLGAAIIVGSQPKRNQEIDIP
jgi:hypothetical protein